MTREEACARLHFVASSQLGVHEGTDTGRIIEYDSHTTLKATDDTVAWCSAFMNYVTDTAGFPGTHSAAAKSWETWGVPLDAPILGCIVVWDHHVTLCDSPDISNGIIRCLGGNQSDAVKVSRFDVEWEGAAKYRSPV